MMKNNDKQIVSLDPILNRKFPCFLDIEKAAQKRMPRFIREYISGGIGQDLGVTRNRTELDNVLLTPRYLVETDDVNIECEILGQQYDAPFGVSPVGFGDLAWPKSAQIIASAAKAHNIPFGSSIFTLCNLETIRQHAGSSAWFQLYHPKDPAVTRDLLLRAETAGYKNLLVTVDVPAPTRRDHDIRNGFLLPVHIGLRNLVELILHPGWTLASTQTGFPVFENFTPYIKDRVSKNEALAVSSDMLAGHVTPDMLSALRENWRGNLIIKGVLDSDEAIQYKSAGADGFVVSNHGGRQLEAAPSPVQVLPQMRNVLGDDVVLIAEGGVRTGLDICRMLALGADFVMAGRPFYCAVAALGAKGASHMMSVLKDELTCTMGQLGCNQLAELSSRLFNENESETSRSVLPF